MRDKSNMWDELSPNYVPVAPFASKSGGHVPHLLWERHTWGIVRYFAERVLNARSDQKIKNAFASLFAWIPAQWKSCCIPTPTRLLNKITSVDYEETNVEWQIEANTASDGDSCETDLGSENETD